jgi:hypothetical protein
LLDGASNTLALREFGDNDDLVNDWQATEQVIDGPVLETVELNDGNAVTSDNDVELDLDTSSSTSSLRMRISNKPSFDSEWISFRRNVDWELPNEEGMHTVYVQLLDSSGQRSLVKTATIEYNRTSVNEWPVHSQ